MQLNVSLIYDRINQGIKDSVESLQDFSKELKLNDGREVFARFIKDDSATEKRFELIDFNNYDNFRFADHLLARRGRGRGFYLAGVSYHHSTETGFFLRFNKISATEIECIVEEKVALSSKDSRMSLFENGQKIYTGDLSYRELLELFVRICQCTPETLLKSIFPHTPNEIKSKLNDICNADGEIKDEYKDQGIFGLIQDRVTEKEFRSEMVYRRTLENLGVPLMNRGWSKSYRFTVDISDAFVHLNESQVKSMSAIEERIREVLNEKIPQCVERRLINRLDLSTMVENIAVRDPRCETGVYTSVKDEDGDVATTALAILEDEKSGDLIFGTSRGVEQFVALEKYIRADGQQDRYSFELQFSAGVSGTANYMFYKDGHLMWLNDVIEDIMVENRLTEDSYDSIREELFETYRNTLSICHWDVIGVRLSIDFSDLFED